MQKCSNSKKNNSFFSILYFLRDHTKSKRIYVFEFNKKKTIDDDDVKFRLSRGFKLKNNSSAQMKTA